MSSAPPLLSPVEARVLGVLVEKQHTVPDTYPLSLNALVSGCNQRSSRDPVLDLAESEVIEALDGLKHRSLVMESSGSRVARYAQNAQKVLQVPSEAVALLATLMLRGPQTPGELRINSDRLHRFADVSSVEAYLEELATRPSGALVAALPRVPGTRETRWTHLLCGAPALSTPGGGDPAALPAAGAAAASGVLSRIDALEARLEALETELASLRGQRARGGESGS